MFFTACCKLVFIIQRQSVSCFYKFNLLPYQSALTLIRSTNRNEVELSEANLFYFLWIGKSQTALKGGSWLAFVSSLLSFGFSFTRGACQCANK